MVLKQRNDENVLVVFLDYLLLGHNFYYCMDTGVRYHVCYGAVIVPVGSTFVAGNNRMDESELLKVPEEVLMKQHARFLRCILIVKMDRDGITTFSDASDCLTLNSILRR